MILVTVGTHNAQFDRLVRAADELAGETQETVIVQRGAATYVPRNAESVDFVEETQMARWVAEARVVVAHAGAGTILNALRAGKPLVLAPRRADLGEHIDRHQFELARALDDSRRAVMVTDLSGQGLRLAIEGAEKLGKLELQLTTLHTFLHNWLEETAKVLTQKGHRRGHGLLTRQTERGRHAWRGEELE